MPPTPKAKLSAEIEARLRQDIRGWMTHHGHDEASFAALLEVKRETVELNLGAERFRTKRGISGKFLQKVEQVTGLRCADTLATSSPPASRRFVQDPESELVLFLGRAGIARANQLARLVGKSLSQFNRLAAKMVKDKLLIRERNSAPTGLSRAQEYVYGLNTAGLARAARQLDRPCRSWFSGGHLKAGLYLDHNLLVTEVALRLALPLGRRLVDWATDADARDGTRSGYGRAVVEPDLICVLETPAGRRGRWIEVETGQQGHKAVHRKVEAIDQYCLSGGGRRQWQTDHWLAMWIAPNPTHTQRIRDWVGELRPRIMHWVTSWEQIQTMGMVAQIWWAINSDERQALL
jgi:hypothetical protein